MISPNTSNEPRVQRLDELVTNGCDSNYRPVWCNRVLCRHTAHWLQRALLNIASAGPECAVCVAVAPMDGEWGKQGQISPCTAAAGAAWLITRLKLQDTMQRHVIAYSFVSRWRTKDSRLWYSGRTAAFSLSRSNNIVIRIRVKRHFTKFPLGEAEWWAFVAFNHASLRNSEEKCAFSGRINDIKKLEKRWIPEKWPTWTRRGFTWVT